MVAATILVPPAPTTPDQPACYAALLRPWEQLPAELSDGRLDAHMLHALAHGRALMRTPGISGDSHIRRPAPRGREVVEAIREALPGIRQGALSWKTNWAGLQTPATDADWTWLIIYRRPWIGVGLVHVPSHHLTAFLCLDVAFSATAFCGFSPTNRGQCSHKGIRGTGGWLCTTGHIQLMATIRGQL